MLAAAGGSEANGGRLGLCLLFLDRALDIFYRTRLLVKKAYLGEAGFVVDQVREVL